jgi:hypothetical protein
VDEVELGPLGEERGGGPGFGAGQERLGPSCSGHGGGAKHSQTAFKTVLGFFSVFLSRTDTYADF